VGVEVLAAQGNEQHARRKCAGVGADRVDLDVAADVPAFAP
jgi:hypothetical protein